jgi:hypothetical protein
MASLYRVPVVVASNPRGASKSVMTFLKNLPNMRIVGQEGSVTEAMATARKHNAHVVVLTGRFRKNDVVRLWKQGAFEFDDD